MNLPTTVYDLTLSELKTWVAEQGQPPYRANQIFESVYHRGLEDPVSWKQLPLDFRQACIRRLSGPTLAPAEKQNSADGTWKWLSKLQDGQYLETVLIPSDSRKTICVSTQVGCAYGCAFCASGMKGFRRNLTAGEIVQQVVLIDRHLKSVPGTEIGTGHQNRVSNIVFMGMGEPLANFDSLLKAIRILNAPEGLNIGARKITISTVGLIPMIERLGKEGLQLELSVSLHAPNDELRGRLMPVNRKYPVKQLIEACRAYVRATKRLITFEYILIDQVNDGPEQAKELAVLLRGLLCKVNLIPCHPIPEVLFKRPPLDRMLAFERILREKKITCTLRRSRGLDIEGACGQLRLRQLLESADRPV